MPLAPGNPQLIKNLGWHQGSVLPQELVLHLLEEGKIHELNPEADLLLIVSHDCDVTHHSYNAEPTVEVLWRSLLEKLTETCRIVRIRGGYNLRLETSPQHKSMKCAFTSGQRLLVSYWNHTHLV